MGNFIITGQFDANGMEDRLTVEENGRATLELNLSDTGEAGDVKTFTISGLVNGSKITGLEQIANNLKITTNDGSQYELNADSFNSKYTPNMPVNARYFGTVAQADVSVPTRGRSSGASGYGSGGGNIGGKGDGGVGDASRTSDVLITIPLSGGKKQYMHGIVTEDRTITNSPSFTALDGHAVDIVENGRKRSMKIYVRSFDADDFLALEKSALALHQQPEFKIENHEESTQTMPKGYVVEATKQFESVLIPKIRYAYGRYLTATRDQNRIVIDVKIHFKEDGTCYVTFENEVNERLKGAVHDAASYLHYPQLSRELPIHYKFNLNPPQDNP